MVLHVANRLGSLLDEVVFVGGSAAPFIITDKAASGIRPTVDVDIIIQLSSRKDYYEMEDMLRSIGFIQKPMEDALLCRWEIDGIKVDIMPTKAKITGIANRWFEEAWSNAVRLELNDNLEIKVISASYFVATKLEAFFDRGENSYRDSKDLEDVIAVVDGSPGLLKEVESRSDELKNYLASKFSFLLKDDEFQESLPGHLAPDTASQARLTELLIKMKKLSQLNCQEP